MAGGATAQVARPPDHIVFDLDPGEGTSIVECSEIALFDRCLGRGGHDMSKTSGSKGLQVYAALTKNPTLGQVAHPRAPHRRALKHDVPIW